MIKDYDKLKCTTMCPEPDMKGVHLELDDTQIEYDVSVDRDLFLENKEEQGYVVLSPLPNEAFIDIDTEEDYNEFLDRFEFFKHYIYGRVGSFRALLPISFTETPSKSGFPKRHIVVKFPFNLTEGERIAVQFALNSDPVREFLSTLRHICDEPRPTVFFEDGYQNVKKLQDEKR